MMVLVWGVAGFGRGRVHGCVFGGEVESNQGLTWGIIKRETGVLYVWGWALF